MMRRDVQCVVLVVLVAVCVGGTVPVQGAYRHNVVLQVHRALKCSDCFATVKTPMLEQNTPRNESENIQVRSCDSGPLTSSLTPGTGNNVTINLTFYSSVILDASPPTCTIPFSGRFLTPDSMRDKRERLPSVLPGCATQDSREGYHMTYYWFYVHDWFTG